MGLAAPKNKIKLSHDPNNTKWTKDTSSFGHKIMTSQGWTPGQYLGNQSSGHAEFLTAANASHIRVVLKDDNLGLGAKRGSGVSAGECTGLDGFKMLLGRLNGAGDDELAEMEKEQKSREDLKRAIYAERKWGSIRFVKGGLLIGDKIQQLIEDEDARVKGLEKKKSSAAEGCSSDSSDSDDEEVVEEVKVKKSKKSKKEKKSRKSSKEQASEDESSTSEKTSKSEKKKSKRKADTLSSDDDDSTPATESKKKKHKHSKSKNSSSEVQKANDKSARKAAKKAVRRAEKARAEGVTSLSLPTSIVATPVSSTPSSQPGTPNSMMMGGRHAVRSRNIMQKRMASMDTAALNQIFMIKS